MIQKNLLNRALLRSLRQVQIRHFERFRCKEPLAQELIKQFNKAVPDLTAKDALSNLLIFSKQLKNWIDENDKTLNNHLGESLLSPQPNIINKPQPPFISSVIATLIRYEILTSYLPILYHFDIGCILGGSLSYGNFFNIRQNAGYEYNKQSDIDLILVADFDYLEDIIDKFKSYIELGVKEAAHIQYFINGLTPIIKIIKEEASRIELSRTIISKKFKIEEKFKVGEIFYNFNDKCSFPLSIHIMPKQVFEILTNPVSYKDYTISNFIKKNTLYDIRLDSKLPDFMVYSIMEGTMVPESLSRVIKRDQDVIFGTSKAKLSICEIPPYFYWEGRFVSGIYQNLIIPLFEVLLDTKEELLEKNCKKFTKFLLDESLRELSEFRDSRLSLSKLHPRHIIFPEYVNRKINKCVERHLTVEEKNITISYEKLENIIIRKKFHQKYRKDQSIYNRIESLIMNNDYHSVLELGCGSGDFLHSLEMTGHRGVRVGIDLVNNFNYERNTGIFLQGNIEELTDVLNNNGFKGKKFNVIVAIHVLYHIKNVSLLLEEITSWLDSSGQFISTTNSNQNLFFINDVMSQALFNLKIKSLYDKKYNNYSAENALDVLREYFSFVQNTLTESDIVLNDYQDVIDYLESNFDNYEIPNDKVIRTKLLEEIVRLTNIKAANGSIKDRKIVSLIVAKEPIKFHF